MENGLIRFGPNEAIETNCLRKTVTSMLVESCTPDADTSLRTGTFCLESVHTYHHIGANEGRRQQSAIFNVSGGGGSSSVNTQPTGSSTPNAERDDLHVPITQEPVPGNVAEAAQSRYYNLSAIFNSVKCFPNTFYMTGTSHRQGFEKKEKKRNYCALMLPTHYLFRSVKNTVLFLVDHIFFLIVLCMCPSVLVFIMKALRIICSG